MNSGRGLVKKKDIAVLIYQKDIVESIYWIIFSIERNELFAFRNCKLAVGFYNVIIKSDSETYHTKLIKK